MKKSNRNKELPSVPQLNIFTRDGKTFTFKQIRELVTNKYSISFQYTAMSDGKIKRGMFFVSNLAGYSVTAEY